MTYRFPPILGLLFPQYGYFFDMQRYVQYMFNIEQYLCDTYVTRNMVPVLIFCCCFITTDTHFSR